MAKKDYYTISVQFAVEYSSVSLPDTVPKKLRMGNHISAVLSETVV